MRSVTRVFFLVARVFGGVSTLFHYCAAATLSIQELKDGIRSDWQDFNLSEDEIEEGLVPSEHDLVDRFVKAGDAVLLIGSGSGRDVLLLLLLLPDSRRRVAALRKAATHLAVGGHVFLNYPIEARPNTLRIRFAQAVGAVCGSDWRLELGDAIAWTGSHYAYSHAFSPEEIAAEVDAAGLRVVYRRDDQNEMAIALTAH